MKHLFSYSVYQGMELFGDEPATTLGSLRCDGLELLTAFSPVDPVYAGLTAAVHLPYAPDWLAAWEERPYEADEETSLYLMYGRSRAQLLDNIYRCIESAEPLHPAHGVLHACNANLPEVRKRSSSIDDDRVILAFCEMVNEVASRFPGGEPPFKIVFENLWWPGLRLNGNRGFDLLSRRMEFDNWGICLDTGHLMNCIPGILTEQDGIDAVTRIVSGYGDELISRISTVHFHFSASGEYRATFPEEDFGGSVEDFYWGAYKHVSAIDQHRDFSDPACVSIIDIVQPEFVVHELPGKINGPLNDFRQQRSLFDRRSNCFRIRAPASLPGIIILLYHLPIGRR